MIAPINGSDIKVRLKVLTEEVSASRWGLWSACRLKFFFRYLRQVPSHQHQPCTWAGSFTRSCKRGTWPGGGGEELSPSIRAQLLEERWKEQEPGID